MSKKSDWSGHTVYTWNVGSSQFRAIPETGGRLLDWEVIAGGHQRQVLYWPETADPKNLAKVRGGNPILFPFCGRSFDKGMENYWKAPDKKRHPMPQHGFARGGRFKLEEMTENGFTALLDPPEASHEWYPFAYEFRVEYRFEELTLKTRLRLYNQDEKPIPWAAGHHFYFALPWHPGAKRSDYEIQLEARKCAYHGPDGSLVSERDRETVHNFGNSNLVNRIHYQLKHNQIQFGPRGGEEMVHIIMGNTLVPPPGYTLVTWTESPESPFYCVEPWMAPPNAPEHKKGLDWVNPGEEDHFEVEISLY